MRLSRIELVTRGDEVIRLANQEDWVVELTVGDVDHGCVVCPDRMRPQKVGQERSDELWTELVATAVARVAELEDDEEGVLRDVLLVVLPHLT